MRSDRSAVSRLGVLPAAGPGRFRTGPLADLAEAVETSLIARVGVQQTDLVALDTTPVTGSWRRRLRPLLRALPVGSRLVFNALSQDYLDATGHPAPAAHPRPAAVTVPELARFATAHDLALQAVVPYGALLGHPLGGKSLLAPLDGSHRWRRSVSWLARDPDLTRLFRFLEEQVVPALPPGAAPYLLVVMERRIDPTANARHERLRSSAAAPTVDDLLETVRRLAAPDSTLAEVLDPLLVPLKTRGVAFELLDQLGSRWPGFEPAAVLLPERAGEYANWRRANRINHEVVELAREWPDDCPERVLHGTDLTVSLDYGLVRDLLEQYYGLYEERLG